MSVPKKHPVLRIVTLTALVLVGLLTLVVGSAVLLDLFGMREKEGNFVPFVVVSNLIGGFLYLGAARYLFKNDLAAVKTLTVCLILLLGTFVGLYFYIASGGSYERRTLFAMTFRIGLTLILTLSSTKILNSVENKP